MCKKPNVIMIVADDMGYGDFGRFGDGISETPYLDKLVEEGVTLTEHYSASPVCAPARATLLTGRYPHRTGAVDTYEGVGDDRLSMTEKTMADYFKEAGYQTGLIGKWHLGSIGKEYHPLNRGFDTFYGFQGGWSHYYHAPIEREGVLMKEEGYLTHRLTEEACSFIERHQEAPFFLHLAYNAPHFPFECPQESFERFANRGLTKEVATLYGMIYEMDQGIGQVLERLKKCSLEEQTIVIFMSDNGPELSGVMNRFNCQLNGEKGLVLEGGIKVPAVVRWKGNLKENIQSDTLFHARDWLPTLIQMCQMKVEVTNVFDGCDQSTILFESVHPHSEEELWHFWQWNRFTPVSKCNAAVRKGKWKLVWEVIDEAMYVPQEVVALDEALKEGTIHLENPRLIDDQLFRKELLATPPLLFNLDKDPYEKENISIQYPDIVEELTEGFEGWFEEVMHDYRKARK